METIGSRILACIKALGMTKTAFGQQLHLSQPHISRITCDDVAPSERTISDICAKFNVDETWLRTGQGEMFRPVSRDEEIMEFMGDVMSGTPSDFRRRFISVLARMTPEEWAILEAKIKELAAELPEQKKEPDAE